MENLIRIADLKKSVSSSSLVRLSDNCFEIELSGKTLTIEVLSFDLDNKQLQIRNNHRVYDLTFKHSIDEILDSMGIKRTSDDKNTSIKAPMPGKVLEVVAKEGDHVQKGGPILILEAMKMENVLKAENDCVIRKVLITTQENVEKNQVLVELD